MTGHVTWEIVLFTAAFGIGVAVLVWWLSEQFRLTRHSINNALQPIFAELDDLKERVIRLEALTRQNGKH